MKPDARLFLAVVLSATSMGASAHGPHVHGTGELRVAVENNRIDIEFQSPLENLLGFEHAPRTDAQRTAVKTMTAKLNRPETLFKFPKAASCTAGRTRIESQFNGPAAAPPKSAKPANKDDDEDDHADLTATFSFKCAAMAKLDSMEIAIFEAFPGTRTIKAEIIGPRGQSAATLTAKRRLIRF